MRRRSAAFRRGLRPARPGFPAPFVRLVKLLGPAAHRLTMHPNLPGHLRLWNSLLQQPGAEQATLFQLIKVPRILLGFPCP